MKKLSFIFCFVLILSATASYAGSNDETAIRTVFNAYKNAALTDKGAVAVTLLDSRTLRYYETVAQLVKYADSTQLARGSFIDRITVLAARMMLPPDSIMAMNGKTFLVWALSTGLISKNGVVSTTLGQVTVSKDFAKAEPVKGGTHGETYFHFYRENGVWKFNLADLFPIAEAGMKQFLAEDGETEESLLMKVLPAMAHRTIEKFPWAPIAR